MRFAAQRCQDLAPRVHIILLLLLRKSREACKEERSLGAFGCDSFSGVLEPSCQAVSQLDLVFAYSIVSDHIMPSMKRGLLSCIATAAAVACSWLGRLNFCLRKLKKKRAEFKYTSSNSFFWSPGK